MKNKQMKNKTLVTQKISNSNLFNEVERAIDIIGINMNSDLASFDLYYRINYTKNDKDVSNLFNQQVPAWHIDNTQLIIVRDENFQPCENPEFKEDKDEQGNITNEDQRYLLTPAFDYIMMLILEKEYSLKSILAMYIIEEDKDCRFNF